MSRCEVCHLRSNKKKQIKKFRINLPVFAHSNFKEISNHCYYNICQNCGLVSIQQNSKISKSLKLLKSKKYIFTRQSDQIKSFKKNNLKTRVELQFDCIKKFIKKKNFKLLDIGCYDGRLTKLFKKNFPESDVHGYDQNQYLKRYFRNSKIRFSSNFAFKQKFDLILISHSLQYIPNINNFFNKIKKIINKNTLIFIQLPDLSKNIYNNLFGDQHYLLSNTFLLNFTNILGLKIISKKKNYFSNEILLIVKYGAKSKKKLKKDKIIINNFVKLKKIKLILTKLKGSFYIFGTSINSVFINYFLKSKNLGYVDDNASKKIFLKKKVFLPSGLKKNSKLIFTYNSKKELKIRLKKIFKKNLISI